VSPRGALRLSLILWGLGQVAAGDRRGWLGLPLQLSALGSLGWFAANAAQGSNAIFVFLGGVAVLALWAFIAGHAYRTATRRHAALDVAPRAAGAFELLWLSPFVVFGSTLLWASGGRLADPGTVAADYVGDWRAGQAEAAIQRFAAPPGDPGAVNQTWTQQLAGLRNDLVRVAAVAGDDVRIDPDDPLDSIVWIAQPTGESRSAIIDIEAVRTQPVQTQLLGLLPATSQRTETLERLGRIELRLVDLPGPVAGQGWRIVRVEAGGVALGG
jgi:hypothetical protein